MYIYSMLLKRNIWVPIFEGESTPPQPPPPPPTQTQTSEPDELKAARSELKAAKDTILQFTDQINTLTAKIDMSKRDREDLDKQVTDLRGKLMTKEQLEQEERQRLVKESNEKLTQAEESAKRNGRMFMKNGIEAALEKALDGKVKSKELLKTYLREKTTYIPLVGSDGKTVLDRDGDPVHVARVKISTVTDKGEPIDLDLTVDQALERLKADPNFEDVFVGSGTGGIQGRSEDGRSKVSIEDLAKDPERYRKARADGTLKL